MNLNRRTFIGASSAFMIAGCKTALTYAANDKIKIGVVGVGRISTSMEMRGVFKCFDKAIITAVCDLDKRRQIFGKKKIEAEYALNHGLVDFEVATYDDYIEMIRTADIDAVMVCVPDFWHALVASEAIRAGKAVWMQKPFTQTIHEGRIIANLAKKYNTVLQVGSQQRSWSQFEAVVRSVREGKLGDIKKVEIGLGIDVAGGCSKAEPVPSTFDYDTWLGPTDHNVPYNWTRCHQQDLSKIENRPGWIQLAPYGWGMITNWGAHHIDIANWALSTGGRIGPEAVAGTCEWLDLSGDKLWNVHTSYDLHFTYGKTDVHVCDKYQNGIKFINEKGDWMFCTRGKMKVTASDPEPIAVPGELPRLAVSAGLQLPTERQDLIATKENQAGDIHVKNWIDAIVARNPRLTRTNAELGHRSTSVCSLGQMVMELSRGRKDGASFKWCTKTESTGNAAIDKMMTPFANGKFDLKVGLKADGFDYEEMIKA